MYENIFVKQRIVYEKQPSVVRKVILFFVMTITTVQNFNENNI